MAKNNQVILFSLFFISKEISNIRERNTALISLVTQKEKYMTALADKSRERYKSYLRKRIVIFSWISD